MFESIVDYLLTLDKTVVSMIICGLWWIVGFMSHKVLTMIKKSPEEKVIFDYVKKQKKIEDDWRNAKGNSTIVAAAFLFLLGIFVCLVLLGYIHLPRIGIYFW